jgi:hypothetical protein
MASAKLLIGSAGAAALAVRVTRSLYGRWSELPADERRRIEPLAERAKSSALDLRGAADRQAAEAELREAGESLAAALVASAEGDPEVDAEEVDRLREDLRLELERLAEGEIKASRSSRGANGAPQ